jgi:hypothetical protein
VDFELLEVLLPPLASPPEALELAEPPTTDDDVLEDPPWPAPPAALELDPALLLEPPLPVPVAPPLSPPPPELPLQPQRAMNNTVAVQPTVCRMSVLSWSAGAPV